MSRSKRKLEHINNAIRLEQPSDSSFTDIRFIHQSLPNISLSDVTLNTSIGELKFSSPIFINAMTGGGGEGTANINAQLAEIANNLSIPIAVGSQMAAVKDPSEEKSYKIVRKCHPKGLIFANIGSEATVEQAQASVDMIEANALQIHLNVIQELVMPEGDRDFSSAIKRIEKICKGIHVPIIVKEVGFGMNRETVQQLKSVGVSIVDVGGYGGTNFSKIENMRREERHTFFDNWGIPTPVSICEAVSISSIPVIASGGIQNAIDVAKSIALGANASGMAGTILNWLQKGNVDIATSNLIQLQEELKMIMTAIGAASIDELQHAPVIIQGLTKEWLTERKIDTKHYANRIIQK